MGKRGKKKFGPRGSRAADFTPIVRKNERFESYYNGLGIVPEEEREQFWEAMRRDLPNSFRFTGSRRHALAVQERLKDFYIPKITSIEYEGAPVEPPRPVPWYPDQLAWSMTTPKNVVRRFPPFAAFQKFLVSETEVGNISRQEVVSMIPPLVLDVKPGMVVLDMCAAPGSKAAQIMEMIHAGEEDRMEIIAAQRARSEGAGSNKGDVDMPTLFPGDVEQGIVEDDGRSTGLLIANDADWKRAHMLIHQLKRLNSPNLIVTNHDATMFPSIKLPPEKAADGTVVSNRYLKFDRILADVPCSGDGTTRKNVSVWRDWSPTNALGLHATQTRILVRALQMLKVGGRVVYSTCSMNPVENEAVIASVIDRCGGSSKVEIVDCSDKLPGLRRSPGLAKWSVMDKEGVTWHSWNDVQEATQAGKPPAGKFVEGMFPPTAEDPGLDLTRCMRVYAHQQDTGGFFITVLEKKGEIRAKPENPPKQSTSMSTTAEKQKKESGESSDKASSTETAPAAGPGQEAASSEGPGASPVKRKSTDQEQEQLAKRQKVSDDTNHKIGEAEASMQSTPALPANSVDSAPASERPQKKSKPGQPTEEPFRYIDPSLEELQSIFDFYDISAQFPRDRFMVRNADGRLAKTVYYSSALARDILTENEGSGIKFVHCGVKMFVKQDVQKPGVCPWRIQTDGLQILESWVGSRRIVKIYKKETLRKLLIEMFPKVSDGGWRELGEIGEWARNAEMGCFVLRLEPSDDEDGFNERMVLPIWRSLHSLNLMLPKEDRRALLLRLFNDDRPLINTTAKREGSYQHRDAGEMEKAELRATSPSVSSENPETEGTIIGDNVEDTLPSREEEEAIKRDNLVLGQEEQDAMSARETYVRAGDEEDVTNTTV
ncbi:hypothetical protein VTO42DRAFT_5804 [Malbranchea cinnamomea]